MRKSARGERDSSPIGVKPALLSYKAGTGDCLFDPDEPNQVFVRPRVAGARSPVDEEVAGVLYPRRVTGDSASPLARRAAEAVVSRQSIVQ